SIGWARYRVGILEDTVNANGERIEGAITLLKRAAASASDLGDYVMYEHLGDALWRAGRRADAVQAWEHAAKMAQNTLDRVDGQTDAPPQLVEFVATVRASVEGLMRRRAAANAGGPGGDVEPETPEIFMNLREDALKIPLPDIRPAQTGAPGA